MGTNNNQRIWLWLIQPQDSSNGAACKSYPVNLGNKGRKVLSITKLLFWYGAALTIGLFIGNLH